MASGPRPTGLFFDVILLGGPCWSATPTPEEEATFCGNFQKLADVHLATGGTALLFFKPELLRRRGRTQKGMGQVTL